MMLWDGFTCSYAHKIRSFLYLDGAGLPRQILRKAGIYPVPDPPVPHLLYEPEGSLWRRRADRGYPGLFRKLRICFCSACCYSE